MAKVIWNKQAETEWRKRLLYGLDEFGETTAISFVQRTNYIVDIIKNILRLEYESHYFVIGEKCIGIFT